MRRLAVTAVLLLAILAVLTGLVYPFVAYGVGQVAFDKQVNGSFVTHDGVVVGGRLLGQNFLDAKGNPLRQYFQPRPSDTYTSPYDAAGSATSNLGPSDARLVGFQPGLNRLTATGRTVSAQRVRDEGGSLLRADRQRRAGHRAVGRAEVRTKTKTGEYVCDPDTVPQRAIAYRELNGPSAKTQIPSDAVTASGSGLDPDISVANARLQARRSRPPATSPCRP